ncbi:MAG: hypothetical protein IAG13_02890 [Deltaproteobacteria bacterium]|nr:hypothetical protein [Nannocystaceae bacterium]
MSSADAESLGSSGVAPSVIGSATRIPEVQHEVRAQVDRQRGLCKAAGVRALPTFFSNGRKLIGSLPTGDFQRVIDEERR